MTRCYTKLMLPLLLPYILISSVSIIYLYGQTPDTLWTKSYGGSDDDWGYTVKETSDSGFIIGGATHSFGTDRGYLIKTDQYGDTVWTKTFPNPIQSVLQTNDGGYIFTGGRIIGVAGQHIYVTRTDSIGNPLWTQSFVPSNYDSRIGEIRPTMDSCYVVVGTATEYWQGEYFWSIVLIKINDTGDTLWTKKYGDFYHWGNSIDPTIDNGYIVVGLWSNSICLFKVDSQGDSVWVKFTNGSTPYSVRQTADSGFIRVGDVWAGGTRNIFALKTDSLGETIWTKTYGGSDHDQGFCVRETFDYIYIIAGYSKSYGSSSQDVYLLKIDQNGDSLWARIYGGDSNDIAREIEVTSDGGYIVVGDTKSYGMGGNDIWLLRLATDPGVEEHHNVPDCNRNWGTTILTGSIQLPSDRICKVFDITGRQIHTINPTSGIYFIEVDGEVRQKVIKIR